MECIGRVGSSSPRGINSRLVVLDVLVSHKRTHGGRGRPGWVTAGHKDRRDITGRAPPTAPLPTANYLYVVLLVL